MNAWDILDRYRYLLTKAVSAIRFWADLRIFGIISGILAHPRLIDALQLILLGLTAEVARRIAMFWFFMVRRTFCITSIHHLTDESFDWLMTLWVQDPRWQGSCRQFDCEVSRISSSMRTMPWLCGKKDNKYDSAIHNKFALPRPRYLPCVGDSFTTWYGYTLVRFTRVENDKAKEYYDSESLRVVLLTRSRSRFNQLLAHAKDVYLSEEHDQISIKMIDEHNDDGVWHQVATKSKRSLSTVVVEPGIKEMLHSEITNFCNSGEWYASRGVPWRKGILFHGLPGSGKTSLIHSLASACNMDIYIVSLATSGLTNPKLIRCMMAVPPGCMVVIEDIDADLLGGCVPINREGKSPAGSKTLQHDTKKRQGVTLSGLLNAIDGIVGAEGRILFMTTNHKHRLDPALIRPGRIDIEVEFTHASKAVCHGLFKAFYPVEGAFPTEYLRRSLSVKKSHESTRKASNSATAEEIQYLANTFSNAIPEGEFSSAEIQGFLLLHKGYPGDAVDKLPVWISDKRKERSSLISIDSRIEGSDTPGVADAKLAI